MTDRDSLIDAFVRRRALLLVAAEGVPPERRTTLFVGHWNLLDLLAHLVGWDYTNVKAIEELKAGRIPDFYRHYDPGWAAYNQQLIERYGADDWEVLREGLRQSQAAVVAALGRLTAEEMTRTLSGAGRRRPVSIAGILRAALGDEREHLRQIRAFVGAPPEEH
jgi:hypothetical protein